MSDGTDTTAGSADDRERLYFRQLLAGQHFAQNDPIAQQMVNFTYVIGDRQHGVAMVVDPAYDIAGIAEIVAADGMRLVGALVTHYHADHIGGEMRGHPIQGLHELLTLDSMLPVHVQKTEAEFVLKQTQLSKSDLVLHEGGDVLQVGSIPFTLLHTPGHTPGSQCFLFDGALVAGDTLFLEGCGRTDLPGGDSDALYDSIHNVLAKVPDNSILFPGHLYSQAPAAPMGEVRQANPVFRPQSVEEWRSLFGPR